MILGGKFIDRFSFELSGRIVAAVFRGLLLVLLARFLGANEYGLFFLALSVFSVAEVFSRAGFAKSGARYVTEYIQHAPGQVSHIIRISFLFTLSTTILSAAVLYYFSSSIAILFGEPRLAPLLEIGPIFIIASTLVYYHRTLLQGFEDIRKSSILHGSKAVLLFIITVPAAYLGYEAYGILVTYIIALSSAAVVGTYFTYSSLMQYQSDNRVENGLRKRIFEYNIPLTATKGANIIDKRVDILLVGYFLNPVFVSYYVISKQVVNFAEVPVSALGFTLSPAFSRQRIEEGVSKSARTYEDALIVTLLLYVPGAFGLFVLAGDVIKYVFGEEYLGGKVVLQLLSVFLVLQAVMYITSNGLDYLGRARSRAIVKVTTSILNIILNVILIPIWGVEGAALATVITFTIYSIANIVIINSELNVDFTRVRTPVLKVVAISGMMAVLVNYASKWVGGIITLVCVVLLGIAIWIIGINVLGLIESDGKMVKLSNRI